MCWGAPIYNKNKSIHEIVKEEKEIRTSFAVIPQTAEVMATVHDKCLVSMEKALNLYNKMFWESPHSHNFYYSVLL